MCTDISTGAVTKKRGRESDGGSAPEPPKRRQRKAGKGAKIDNEAVHRTLTTSFPAGPVEDAEMDEPEVEEQDVEMEEAETKQQRGSNKGKGKKVSSE